MITPIIKTVTMRRFEETVGSELFVEILYDIIKIVETSDDVDAELRLLNMDFELEEDKELVNGLANDYIGMLTRFGLDSVRISFFDMTKNTLIIDT